MKKKFSIFLIAIGIITIITPIIGKLNNTHRQKILLSQINEKLIDNNEKLQNTLDVENKLPDKTDISPVPQHKSQLSATPTPELKPDSSQISGQKVLGIIEIKKIDCFLPIVEGIEQYNLKDGIGHMPDTAMPSEVGNSVLAGHRNYTFGTYFNRLDEIDIGDEISITDLNGKKTKYIVFNKKVVVPEDTSILKSEEHDKLITLITCTPIYIASHRLIIQAKVE